MRLIVTDVVPNLNPTFILGQDFLCDDDVNLQFTKNSMSPNIDPVRKVVAFYYSTQIAGGTDRQN